MEKKHYGLFTAITMIVGIVIGSGIFFKADEVLLYTKGNLLLGIIVFIVAALSIIFGCLTVSELATRTDKPGGFITYAQEFIGIKTSCAFGWFQTFLYLPALTAVVSWVTGVYICQLFRVSSTLENQVLIGLVNMTALFLINTLSYKLGGLFQNAAMIIKLIPLLLIAVAGILFGNPGPIIADNIHGFRNAAASGSFMTAFAPISFSFDGWIVSTSICHEIKNSKRNLPLALTISPLIILVVYIAYFTGITSFVGADNIMKQGDESIYTVSKMILGAGNAKLILIFVIISVLGTVNGLVLGFIRMPYSLALRNMLPYSKVLSKESERLGNMPFSSAIFAYVLSLFWMLLHYLTQRNRMRGDVSEIAIGVNYLNFILLYFAVIRLANKKEIKGVIKGYLIPALAIIGSLIIISGSFSQPLFPYYITISIAIMMAGVIFYKKLQ